MTSSHDRAKKAHATHGIIEEITGMGPALVQVITGSDKMENEIAGSYVWVFGSWSDGQDVTEDELEGLESILGDAAPDGVDFTVRHPWGTEADGLYRDGQLLGYTVPVPDEINELMNLALAALY